MIALSGPPVLETARLRLRAPVASDLGPFTAYVTSDRAAAVRGAATEGQAFSQFAVQVGHWVARGFGRFTIVERATGAAIGHVGPLAPPDWPEPELTWTLWDTAHEGKGYALEAARAAKDWMAEALGFVAPISMILATNARSAALARRLGAEMEATEEKSWGTVDIYRHRSSL